MKQTYCLGGLHYSITNNKTQYEKRNPKTKKLFKILKGKCAICVRNKSQIFTKKMTRGESFVKKCRICTGTSISYEYFSVV